MKPTVIIALLVGLLALAPASASAQSPAPDWNLVRVTAGADGLRMSQVTVAHTAVARDDGPTVNGVGVGSTAFDGGVIPFPAAGGGPLTLSSTQDLGGIDVTVMPKAERREPTQTLFTDLNLAPGETVGLLVFSPGASMTGLEVVRGDVLAGSVAGFTVTSGTGSRAVRQARPGSGGLGLNLGPIAVGSTTTSETTTAAVAGGFMAFGCGNCVAEVTPPGAEPIGFANLDYFVGGASGDQLARDLQLDLPAGQTFTGGAGSYRFAWTGAAVNGLSQVLNGPRDNTYAAYAPVGPGAELFSDKP